MLGERELDRFHQDRGVASALNLDGNAIERNVLQQGGQLGSTRQAMGNFLLAGQAGGQAEEPG